MARLLMTLLLSVVLVSSYTVQASMSQPSLDHNIKVVKPMSVDSSYVEPMPSELVARVNAPKYDQDIAVDVIKHWEGSTDSLYWPSGESGPTIACGIDLGNIGKTSIQQIFTGIVGRDTVQLLMHAANVRGTQAKAFTRRYHKLKLSRSQIDEANKKMFAIVWDELESNFPGIDKAPAKVKTSVFSVALNRGLHNKKLVCLKHPIADRQWFKVAAIIGAMPAPKGMRGIARRRVMESELIRQKEFTNDVD